MASVRRHRKTALAHCESTIRFPAVLTVQCMTLLCVLLYVQSYTIVCFHCLSGYPARPRYQLMMECWDLNPNLRPTFSSILERIQNMILCKQASPCLAIILSNTLHSCCSFDTDSLYI